MIFNFRKQERLIQSKEAEITKLNKDLHRKVNKDRKTLGEINKALSNGVTLKIYQATHGSHHAK